MEAVETLETETEKFHCFSFQNKSAHSSTCSSSVTTVTTKTITINKETFISTEKLQIDFKMKETPDYNQEEVMLENEIGVR